MRVQIDGIDYEAVGEQRPDFAVAVTTRNRGKVLAETLDTIHEHTPDTVPVLVVDDASDKPVDGADYRFETNAGIARAKNKCLELLQRTAARHWFLFDDDVDVLTDDWWAPYIDSREPHLAAGFTDLAGPRKLRDITVTYTGDGHVAYTGQRGFMLYYDAAVIDTVGGFDPVYGSLFEHADLALRIWHAGLTSYPFMDVAGSDKLFRSLDQYEEVERTIGTAERQRLAKRNAALYSRRRDTGEFPAYIEYREQHDAVLTCLFAGRPDPQRPGRTVKVAELRPLLDSITSAEAVVFTDAAGDIPNATAIRAGLDGMPVFHRRWLAYYQHLRDHPEIRSAFCVDGTDVTMLRPPWEHLEPGRLYVGWENQLVGCSWMRTNHQTAALTEFINGHADHTLLNAGVVGGDRATVMAFCHAMVRAYHDNQWRRFWKQETHDVGPDMGIFNQVAYTQFGDRLVTGPQITTVFKAHQGADQSPAWWAHK